MLKTFANLMMVSLLLVTLSGQVALAHGRGVGHSVSNLARQGMHGQQLAAQVRQFQALQGIAQGKGHGLHKGGAGPAGVGQGKKGQGGPGLEQGKGKQGKEKGRGGADFAQGAKRQGKGPNK